MTKKDILYFGGFPPPFGGVTIKNKLLAEALEKTLPIRRMDTRKGKKNPFVLAGQTLRLITGSGPFVVATSKAGRRRITMTLARFNPAALKKSLLIVMGGCIQEDVGGDEPYIAALKRYKRIFVEVPAMKEALEDMGFENVSVYPNCRRDRRVKAIRETGEAGLKCLFFSLICREKGADIILETEIPGVTVDFYGEIQGDYREEFLRKIDASARFRYRGVFPSDGENVYGKLHEYDLLLLPTHYVGEGVPGILIEGKIAALPAVVSNFRYNASLVRDGVSGVVLKETTPQALAETLQALASDRKKVDALKTGALKSAKDYLLENNLDEILSYLR